MRRRLSRCCYPFRRGSVSSRLEGVPCSIHGFVLPDGVAIFRPVELVVLRSISPRRFIYAGISTCWDPSRHDRDEMREVARRVGQHLQREHGYRGGFSVDGVLTADGFLPTELNPRFAGGLSTIGKSVPELPLELVQMATIRGIDLGVGARALEELLVPAADAHRYGSAYNVISAPGPAETESVEVTGGAGWVAPRWVGRLCDRHGRAWAGQPRQPDPIHAGPDVSRDAHGAVCCRDVRTGRPPVEHRDWRGRSCPRRPLADRQRCSTLVSRAVGAQLLTADALLSRAPGVHSSVVPRQPSRARCRAKS
jgi:hypothetical protein